MKQKRDYLFYLEDIEDAMRHVFEFTRDFDFRKFKSTRLVVDAVIRNFEIMGEASKNIPDDIKQKYPEMPWSNIYRLRNIISHDYFGIDYEIIWKIISEYLPKNHKQILTIIEKESDKSDD